MGQYSIKELEKLSGIKAHTIRIWEKRYGLINPSRTDTNIRYYSDHDLKKIINVAAVNNAGVKISHIAKYSDSKLNQMVSHYTDAVLEIVPIDQLIVAMVELDEQSFEKVLANLQRKISFEDLVVTVIYPFLDKIGILWQTGNITPAQEHFISNLLRQKMIVAIDKLPIPSKGATAAVLYLPENEYHEIGLLFYYYLCKHQGLRSIYLGQSVPHSDLKNVVDTHHPKFIVTSIVVSLEDKQLNQNLNRISTDFKDQTILISGRAIQPKDIEEFPNIHSFSSAAALKDLLKS
jgi:MerR family transcriptional regulator, light-induced transcriptional regulator